MGEFSQAGGTALGATIGGVLGVAGNAIASAQNDKYARQQMALQAEYNENAAINADNRTRALYKDLYSPEAQMEQYKNAGLSPSMMYANGVSGTSGQAGAQAGAVGNAGGTGFPMDLAGASAQWAQVIANTRLTNAQANKVEEETKQVEPLATAQIANLAAQAGLAGAEKHLKEAETDWQNLQNDLVSGTWEAQKTTIIAGAQKMLYESMVADEVAKQEKVKTKIAEKTADTQIEQIEKDLLLTIKQIAKTAKDIEVSDAQIQSLLSHINIDAYDAITRRKGIAQSYEISNKEIDVAVDRLDLEEKKMWVGLGEEAIHTIGNIAAGAYMKQMVVGRMAQNVPNAVKKVKELRKAPNLPRVPTVE